MSEVAWRQSWNDYGDNIELAWRRP